MQANYSADKALGSALENLQPREGVFPSHKRGPGGVHHAFLYMPLATLPVTAKGQGTSQSCVWPACSCKLLSTVLLCAAHSGSSTGFSNMSR